MDGIDPRAREEAAAWHARLQWRSVSNDELEAFYAWREDPSNAWAFEQVERVWSRSISLRDDPDIVRLLRGARAPRSLFKWIGSSPFGWRLPVVATAGVLALIATLLFANGVGSGRPTYETRVGERLAVRLDDGSRLTLNTSSRVSVRFASAERDVVLEAGQALFEVAHDPARPFRVISNGASVTAIGTKFEVSRLASGLRVVLLEGAIVVRRAGAPPVRLDRAGQALEMINQRASFGKQDPEIATSWAIGKIDLRDVPLRSALAEVNRYTSKPLILDDPREAGTKVSGVFATGDADAFAAAVEAVLPLKRELAQDGNIHLVEKR